MTSFELFDVESGNLVGSYASEEEARAIALRAYESYGRDGIQGLMLLRVQDDDVHLVAEEDALLQAKVATTVVNPATA